MGHWCDGVEDDGVGAGFAQDVDPDAVAVDGDPDHVQPGRARGREGIIDRRGVLERDPSRPGGGQHADEQRDALRVTRADHDLAGMGHGAADPVQVVGDRRPQLRHAAAGQVAEQLVRRGGERPADRAQPRGPREAGHVGAAVAEVDPRRGLAGQPEPGRDRGRSGRHLRVSPRPAGQVTLRGELLVGLDHHAAGDAEVGGQHPRGRQRRAARQPPGADRVPDRGLDLPVQWSPRVVVEHNEDPGIGPGFIHRTGSYRQDRFLSGSSYANVVPAPSATKAAPSPHPPATKASE